MATNGTVRATERRAAILASLSRDGAVQIDEVATALDVSSMTVRRDFDELEADGLLRRVRGGAVAVNGPQPFGDRQRVNARAKRVIAAKSAELVPSSGAIAVDASSTTGTLVGDIGPRDGLTVATNSYDNFAAVRATPGVNPILIGGEAEKTTGSFVGMIACEGAASLLYTRFFTSATGVDPTHGSSEVSLGEVQVKHAFGEHARSIVLCVDSSKLGRTSVAHGFAFDAISVMITELDPTDARLDEYRGMVELR
ncbi:DeoR/GlpR family DNA-binding transcription regulator [Microbacterium koreense]|uniref:Lactose phosphotransferase system repressor n=1 Tax=Microbacterium koreense TaxID=323761 RepID=A0ABW2ZMX2_9MICO